MHDDETTYPSDAAVVAELATRAADPFSLAPGRFSVVVPEGGRLEPIDLTGVEIQRSLRPPRRRGTHRTFDAASFAALVTALGSRDGTTRIYGSPDSLSFVAVLNDHDPDGNEPGWGDHHVTLTVQRTPSWQAWLDHAGLHTQEEFAEHLEDHRADIADPPAADMLELAQTFHATIGAKFSGGTRLHSGERQASYVEEVQGSAGRAGQLAIPEHMLLKLVPFDGAAPVGVEARIRFRIREGRLTIGYVLHRADEIERAAFDQLRASIETATGITAILGLPAPTVDPLRPPG